MALGASIKAYFGGDTSGLRAAVGDANRMVGDFQKEVKKTGISMGKGFGFGLLIFQAKQFAMEAIEAAQKTRDEFEKLGRPIDGATRSLASLGDGMTGLKKIAVDSVGYLVGGYAQLGEVIGSVINRMRGISEAEENNAAAIVRSLAEVEKAREEAIQKYVLSLAQIREEQKKLADIRYKNSIEGLKEEEKMDLLLVENIRLRKVINTTSETSLAHFQAQAKLEENLSDLRKSDLAISKAKAAIDKKNSDATKSAAEAQKEITQYLWSSEDKRKSALAEISELEKTIAAGMLKGLDVSKEITLAETQRKKVHELDLELKKEHVRLTELELKGVANLTDKEKLEYDILTKQVSKKTIEAELTALLNIATVNLTEADKKRLATLTDIVATEKNITEEKKAQLGFSVASQSTFAEESDATLKEIIRREKLRVFKPTIEGNLTDQIGRAGSQSKIAAAQAELDFRAKFLQDVKFGGEDRARRMFAGDPMEFDRLYSQLTAGLSKDDLIITELEKTNNLLSGKFRNQ